MEGGAQNTWTNRAMTWSSIFIDLCPFCSVYVLSSSKPIPSSPSLVFVLFPWHHCLFCIICLCQHHLYHHLRREINATMQCQHHLTWCQCDMSAPFSTTSVSFCMKILYVSATSDFLELHPQKLLWIALVKTWLNCLISHLASKIPLWCHFWFLK